MTAAEDKFSTDPRIMSTQEVARWLNTSTATLLTQVRDGAVPTSRIGSEVRYWRPLLKRALFDENDPPMPEHDEPEVLTAAQLAAKLQIGVATIRRRATDGSIPAARIGADFRFYWPAIRRRLENGEDFVADEDGGE